MTVRIDVLGSGSAVNLDRQPTAFAVFTAPRSVLLVDAGGGIEVLRQLRQARVPLSAIRRLFVTHTDFDHCGGVVPLLYASALDPAASNSLEVMGSAPVVEQLREVARLLASDLAALDGGRIEWLPLAVERRHELPDGTCLTPFPAEHQRPDLGPTGLLVETAGLRVCFSGDTRSHCSLRRYAEEADLLVHEASLRDEEAELSVPTGHSTPSQAAALARDAGARALLLVHVNIPQDAAAEEALVAEARSLYAGPLAVAHDLMRVTIEPGEAPVFGS
jgi:ribonuclease Z